MADNLYGQKNINSDVFKEPVPDCAADTGDPFGRYRNAAIALGNFDGMHLGHMKLIEILTRRASELDIPSLVYTFHEHPKNVIYGKDSVKLITCADKKRELLGSTAVDGFYVERFDRDFASQTPETFVKRVLVDKFCVRLVVVGAGFRFGSGGRGHTGLLKELGAKSGFDVVEADPVTARGAGTAAGGIISSSGIRALICSGQMEKAGALLGRLFSMKCWIAAYGKASGAINASRAVMYPDARMVAPGPGVYIVSAYIGGVLYRGFAGVNAGIGGVKNVTAIKKYILDFDGDLHEAEIEIFFYKKLDGVLSEDNEEPDAARLIRFASETARYFESPD